MWSLKCSSAFQAAYLVLSTTTYLILTSVHVFVCSLVSQLALNEITISALIGFHDCFCCQDYRKVQLHCSFDELSIHHLLSGVPIQWSRFGCLIIRSLHSHFTLTMLYGFYCMVTDLLTNKFRQVDGHSKIDSDLDQLKSNSGMTLRSNTELNQTKLLNSRHSTKNILQQSSALRYQHFSQSDQSLWYLSLLRVACY